MGKVIRCCVMPSMPKVLAGDYKKTALSQPTVRSAAALKSYPARSAGAKTKSATGATMPERTTAQAVALARPAARSASGRFATAPPSGGKRRTFPPKAERAARSRACECLRAGELRALQQRGAAPVSVQAQRRTETGAPESRQMPAPARFSDCSMQDENRRKSPRRRHRAVGEGTRDPPVPSIYGPPHGKAARRKPRPELAGARKAAGVRGSTPIP
jgi:hypothetical protein